MLTSLGRFLRKLRIDRGEILKDNVSVSFLSAVENGKKRMPAEWNKRIRDLYELDMKQEDEFTSAIAETEKLIEIDFSEMDNSRKELAVSFARRFSNIDDTQIEEIKNILKRR